MINLNEMYWHPILMESDVNDLEINNGMPTEVMGSIMSQWSWKKSVLRVYDVEFKNGHPHSVKMVDDAMFVMSPLPLGDGYIDVPFPVKEKWEEIPGLTILVHPLRFWRHESKCHNRDGCIGNKSINLKVHYTIVSLENPNELAVLAHGGAYDESSFTFAMTKGNWESVVEGIAKKLVEKTPLER